MTYSKAGVNVDREVLAIKNIKKWIGKTFEFRKGRMGEVLSNVGFYANVIDMGDYALAVCMDGVGSKVLVAQELKKYDTVGIDLVAMNVNDVICLGAEPIAMVDYMAFERTDSDLARDLAAGIYEGARIAEIAVVGGETATLPDIITGVDGQGFDMAATVIGVVKKERIITGEKIAPGDVVLGIKSSGIHSNGLTLARKVLPKTMWPALLTPTRIYVKEALEMVRRFDVHGLAHITGSGYLNLGRLTKYGFALSNIPEAMIFRKIQELGNVPVKEMYRTFNMGIGFCIIVDRKEADTILAEYAERFGIQEIGVVTEEPGVRISREGGEFTLDGAK
ncbi:MAG: phosphoribosylformylglycinamidine cyclo-ligase [Candidatus Altiarchaeota archaeon]|nr:phosphoribosylformylglycinamidine cyclo-ligase [Candidatus Altiarchaeota archaeon]